MKKICKNCKWIETSYCILLYWTDGQIEERKCSRFRGDKFVMDKQKGCSFFKLKERERWIKKL